MQYSQVFISYKSEDFDQANWLRSVLEQNGISCWMAPASIPGGSNYAKEIPQAIDHCRVFVLVLTKRCQNSIWVPKELDRALNAQKTVMPFALENCQLNDDFNFYLSNVQRYAAYQNKTAAVAQLLRDIRALLNIPQQPETAPKEIRESASKRFGKWLAVAAAMVVLLLFAVGLGKLDFGSHKSSQNQSSHPRDSAELSADDVLYLEEKTEAFICSADRVTLCRDDGSVNDLYADALSGSVADFTLLEQAYVYADGMQNTLLLPFCLQLEDVPYHWVDNVYYEDPVLVNHPAIYGYAVFAQLEMDQDGNLARKPGYDLLISDLFENKAKMETDLAQKYPEDMDILVLKTHET